MFAAKELLEAVLPSKGVYSQEIASIRGGGSPKGAGFKLGSRDAIRGTQGTLREHLGEGNYRLQRIAA